MLQSIRDRTQGWIAGTIVSLLILSFALWGIHGYFSSKDSITTVAKVNGVEITKTQLAVAYERIRRQLQMQFGANYQLPVEAESEMKQRALQFLIDVQVLKQGSLDQGYRISLSQIDSFLASMPEFQVKGQFSMERFQKTLETTLYNVNDFIELIKTKLLIDQPKLGIVFTSFALPNEIKNTIGLINEERDIQYAIIPLQSQLEPTIQISEYKILSYYKNHEKEFKTPERISIQYIDLSLKDIIETIHPSEEELKKFYSENTSTYVKPMEWKLQSIFVPLKEDASDKEKDFTQKQIDRIFINIKAGKEFLSLQNPLSLSVNSGLTEKLKGWVTINQVPEELQKAVLTLRKSGQVSNAMKVSNGYLILKAVEIKKPLVQPFDQVKQKVKEALVRQQAEEKFSNLSEKLANKSYEHPESLEPVAQALGVPIKTSPMFEKDNSEEEELWGNAKVIQAAFSQNVINLKNNSDVIQLGNDTVLVLRLNNYSPATLLSLDTVKPYITDKLVALEIYSKTMALADEIKKKLQAGLNPEQVMKQYHLTWKKSGFIGRHSSKLDPAIVDASFAMVKPTDLNHNVSYSIIKMPEGYAVIALYAVKEGESKSANNQYQIFNEQIQNAQGLMEYELYKQSLIKQAKVVVRN